MDKGKTLFSHSFKRFQVITLSFLEVSFKTKTVASAGQKSER